MDNFIIDRESRVYKLALLFSLMSGLVFVSPFVFEMDMMRYGFGMQFISFFLIIVGFITAYFYWRRAKALFGFKDVSALLVRWSYGPEQWIAYVDEEYKAERSDKMSILFVIAVISFIVGLAFVIADSEAGVIVFGVLLGVVAICFIFASVLPWLRHRRNRFGTGLVLFTKFGAYVNGDLHLWAEMGASLDDVGINEKDGLFAFEYSAPARHGRQSQIVRVPIPQGKLAEAKDLMEKLSVYL